jgi:hypothetical protein
MSFKLLRLLLPLAAIVAALGASMMAAAATPNNYCDPLGGCRTHFLKVSPGTVKPGNATTVSGTVGNSCKKPGQVTIYSRAFKGATRHEFAGVPAISSTTSRKGKFSKRVTIKKIIKPGRYHVGARCGGGNIGSATLRVTVA